MILSSGNLTTYPLGIGPLILWKLDHLSSGNRTSYLLGFGISSGKRNLGNGTRYPLGFGPLILWENAIMGGEVKPCMHPFYIHIYGMKEGWTMDKVEMMDEVGIR